MTSVESGRKAEDLALKYLEAKGYHLVSRNYRYGRAEVDLIVRQCQTIIFVEVKMRSGTAFGNPEDFVDEAKTARFHEAATYFCEDLEEHLDIRFDIVAMLKRSNQYQIEHFEDAFF